MYRERCCRTHADTSTSVGYGKNGCRNSRAWRVSNGVINASYRRYVHINTPNTLSRTVRCRVRHITKEEEKMVRPHHCWFRLRGTTQRGKKGENTRKKRRKRDLSTTLSASERVPEGECVYDKERERAAWRQAASPKAKNKTKGRESRNETQRWNHRRSPPSPEFTAATSKRHGEPNIKAGRSFYTMRPGKRENNTTTAKNGSLCVSSLLFPFGPSPLPSHPPPLTHRRSSCCTHASRREGGGGEGGGGKRKPRRVDSTRRRKDEEEGDMMQEHAHKNKREQRHRE